MVRDSAGAVESARHAGRGVTSQMSRAYSEIVRSAENQAMRAVL
jgi:hypothetical protein